MMPDWDMNGDTTRAGYEGQITRLQARVSELEAAQEWRPTHKQIVTGEYRFVKDCDLKNPTTGAWWRGFIYDNRAGETLVMAADDWAKAFSILPAPPVGDR